MARREKFSIVEVGKKLTLESVDGNFFTIPSELFERHSMIKPLEDEEKNYQEKITDMIEKVSEFNGDLTNRRIYRSWQTDAKTNLHCITLIQLLMGREKNVMNAYLRSSDIKRFPSDLALLCRLAIGYEVDELQVMIGSFHVYLEE